MADSPVPTPEQIAALGELLRALDASAAPAEGRNFLFEWLPLIGDFIGHAGWPIVVIVALIVFRRTLLEWESVEIGGAKVTRRKMIDREMQAAGSEVAAGNQKVQEPTEGELRRSVVVADLAIDADAAALHRQAKGLAWEYELTRASHLPGPTRTRQMEIIVAKMRAIGRAIFPLRHEFMASSMPGTRLLAIASMQVLPDYESLDWLADRLKLEKPFVSYHAAVALTVAARGPAAAAHKGALLAVRTKVSTIGPELPSDADRNQMLASFEMAVGAL